ncbi:uncharacterized protein FTOL_06368 [Fusarium torulosum]|uniref:Uncharacterized protein n=1 Tax=Fusarium torulosum TaxID=33205 RepID=A0AAE8SI04_9HYPO|nr:uncharacterized protein FTOL_06368 [Fusarium torulosum]
MDVTVQCDGYRSKGVCEGTRTPTNTIWVSEESCPECRKKKAKGVIYSKQQ